MLLTLALALATSAGNAAVTATGQQTAPTSSVEQPAAVTYTNQIAPLITDRCVVCHHEGGAAPFSLESYAEVKRRATQIAVVTSRRQMPPWKADPHDGPFVGQRPLSEAEIALIARWIEDGAREGDVQADTAAAAKPRTWASGWQLGTPDLVVTLPRTYSLQAAGTDVFRIFVLPLPVPAARYVRGLEFHPGNPRVVHHANIRIDRTPASRATSTVPSREPSSTTTTSAKSQCVESR